MSDGKNTPSAWVSNTLRDAGELTWTQAHAIADAITTAVNESPQIFFAPMLGAIDAMKKESLLMNTRRPPQLPVREDARMTRWERAPNLSRESADPYYGVMKPVGDRMAALREMFPEGEANDLNFVLFSTSGVHGTYCTIEAAEEEGTDVTFLVIQPRIVGMRYGNVQPHSPEDYAFLKKLRESSHKAIASIGIAPVKAEGGAPA